jgi:hypothetical protein
MIHAAAGAGRGLASLRKASYVVIQARRTDVKPQAWVGCSHWTTPFRPVRYYTTHDGTSAKTMRGSDSLFDTGNEEDEIQCQEVAGAEAAEEGMVIDQVDPLGLGVSTSGPSSDASVVGLTITKESILRTPNETDRRRNPDPGPPPADQPSPHPSRN